MGRYQTSSQQDIAHRNAAFQGLNHPIPVSFCGLVQALLTCHLPLYLVRCLTMQPAEQRDLILRGRRLETRPVTNELGHLIGNEAYCGVAVNRLV